MKGLTDIAGILVGHASDYDGLTGCTVVLCETGAVAGGDIRGSATGVEEWGVLSPMHVTDRIHGVVFSGGSAFGLESASGVRRFLERKGVGFKTGMGPVPIVVGAILYDLGLGNKSARPTREMAETACAAATDEAVTEGAVGAGTGATVGKILGREHAMKSGVGSWTVALEGHNAGVMVSALAVVNAFGDVRDRATGKILAGARKAVDSMEFADSARLMKSMGPTGFTRENTMQENTLLENTTLENTTLENTTLENTTLENTTLENTTLENTTLENTTLVVVATNAALHKVEATKLAQMGQLGVARAIDPVNTMSDGDLVIALSVGTRQAPVDALGVAAAEAVAEAIARAVRLAPSLGGLPGLKK